MIKIPDIHKTVQWILKVLTFSLSASVFCSFTGWPVPFFLQSSEAVKYVEGKGRATKLQNIENVEIMKHLSHSVQDIKLLILNFSAFKGKRTKVQYMLSLLKILW